MKNLGLLGSLLALILTLQGCVVAVGAAGAMAAKVANDRRTVGTQLDDQNADAAVSYQWSKSDTLKEQANLQVDVYNGVAPRPRSKLYQKNSQPNSNWRTHWRRDSSQRYLVSVEGSH